MKKFILFLIFLIGTGSNLTFSQIIFSNGTGGGLWSDPSTWTGGVVPTLDNDVIINQGDSVLTGSGAACNNLTVSAGAIFATSSDSVIVAAALTLEAGSWFYNQVAEKSELPGAVIIIDPSSTVVHNAGGSVGGEGNLEFGNLIIQKTAGTTAGGNLLIQGDLTINNAQQNQYFRGTDDTHGNQEHTILGNVYIRRGTWSCIDGEGTAGFTSIWNVEGDVYVYGSGFQAPGSGVTPYDARIGPFSSANAAGTGIFNIKGDLIIDGGRLHGGTSSTLSTGTGIINLSGNLTLTANSNVSTTHAGPFALNFIGNGTQIVTFGQRFSMGTNVYDTISAGSNVVFNLGDSTWRSTTGGDFVINGSLELVGNSNISGAGNFTLNPGATLKIGSATGLSATEEMGNILVTGTRTFSSEANYEYKGTESQVPGSGLPATVNGLAVNNGQQLVLFGDYTINNTLNIISGDLDLNSSTVTLGEDALLTETAGNTVIGEGKLTITKNINAPAELNAGGLGAMITTGTDLGSTTIERTHSAASGNGNQGILRQYSIIPAQNNSGLNATLRLYYDESELNGLAEEGLVLFKSPSGEADSWTRMDGIVNTADNYVELSGVTDFSFWTIANINQTLPVKDEKGTPVKYAVHQNYPNPFNPSTTIKFEVPITSFVNLTIYNALGEKIATLINDFMETGYHEINFDAADFPSGIYIYRMTAGDFTSTNKMLLLK